MFLRARRRLASALLLPVAIATAQIASPPVVSERGMVVSASPAATDVGAAILRRGGSAIDAAVATAFALAATYPEAGNLGGGGFLVARLHDGREIAVDFRETAPSRATPDRFRDADGRVVPERSRVGGLAVAVPGSVAGLAYVQKRYGTLPLKDVLAPAIALARDGFPPTPGLLRAVRSESARDLLGRCPDAKRIFLDGLASLEPGEFFRQPELATTLERLATFGPDDFYRGETAKKIVDDLSKKGGAISLDDLSAYEPKERAPLVGSYRGRRVTTMPPPSTGGVALLQALGVFEAYPIEKLGRGSEAEAHLFAETMKRVFRDRVDWASDPDFVAAPIATLTSPAYATLLRRSIGEFATRADAIANPNPLSFEKDETTHFSVMDSRGGAVAVTTTLNGSFGSGIVVSGAGFLLNNEMDDFTIATDAPNLYGLLQGERNLVAAGRRPASSMTPTIVYDGAEPWFVVGSPGGPTIISTVFQTIVAVVDHGMTAAQAVASPRLHHQWAPDVLYVEPFGLAPEVLAGLRRRGHDVVVRGQKGRPVHQGDAQAILRVGRRFEGAADPRREGKASGP
jgi:gamma-glutamyltranspeptidase / glutathione hydrolase